MRGQVVPATAPRRVDAAIVTRVDEETRHLTGPADERLMCASCGRSADDATAPATWVCSVESGRHQYLCDVCARTHLRAIEGRLDSDWW